MDFTGFYKQFSAKLLENNLYLGYYFHLIEDAIYRKFLYYDYQLGGNRGQEFLEALYNDYAILNGYLLKTYRLTNTPKIPEHFTEDMVEELIGKCISTCKMEFEKIQTGKSCLNPLDFAWDR